MTNPKLIYADEIILFPYSETAGTEEWLRDLISETIPQYPDEITDDDLLRLCWKVIDGFLNVVKTERAVEVAEVVRCKVCKYRE